MRVTKIKLYLCPRNILNISIMDEKDSRILVVDDEQDLCEILKFNLETEGYQVDTVTP
jgi:PleD family two-component response regulator